jgi:hypothetical protein
MDEKKESGPAENKEIRELRDDLRRRISMFQHIESMMDENLKEATDAGYRLGWQAGVLAAVERLEKLKMKMAAEKVHVLMDEGPTGSVA